MAKEKVERQPMDPSAVSHEIVSMNGVKDALGVYMERNGYDLLLSRLRSLHPDIASALEVFEEIIHIDGRMGGLGSTQTGINYRDVASPLVRRAYREVYGWDIDDTEEYKMTQVLNRRSY